MSDQNDHKCAVDAVVAATASRAVRPVIVLTSGGDDMDKLCGRTVKVIGVRGPRVTWRRTSGGTGVSCPVGLVSGKA